MSLLLLFLIPAFAFADGWSGGQFGWKKLAFDRGGPLHGHPFVYVALPLVALCYAGGGAAAIAAAVVWLLYRGALGFPDDTITGRNVVATLLRHAQVLVIPLILMVGFHRSWLVLIPFLIYVALAFVLAKWDGDDALDADHPRDINGLIEPARGAVFGLSLVTALAAW